MKESKPRIERLFCEKKKLLDELLEMTMKQTRWIEERNWTRLHNAIDAKQDRIDKIDNLDQLIRKNIALENENQRMDGLEEAPMNQDIEYIAKKIMEIEEKNIKEIRDTMKILKNELKEIQLKKKVNRTYYKKQQTRNSGNHIDKYK